MLLNMGYFIRILFSASVRPLSQLWSAQIISSTRVIRLPFLLIKEIYESGQLTQHNCSCDLDDRPEFIRTSRVKVQSYCRRNDHNKYADV